jgi:predicted adenylyl cyclase CyaB
MKIMIISSKHHYYKIPEIKQELEKLGHIIMLPNSFDEPFKEEDMKKLSPEEHSNWKKQMMLLHEPKIKQNDAVLVLNLEKNNQQNYIGGATFMEIVKAWELEKKIFFYNPIPDNIFKDEILGINPIIINQNLNEIEENIEVEIRSFITKEKYNELLEFFENNSKKIKEDHQETFYFDSNEDLRIQKSDSHSKIWLKKGKIHDDYREEIEIKLNKEDFEKANKIFEAIGLNTKIKWYRLRNQFDWNNIKVCLDYTKGYGHIIELEKLTSNKEKEKNLEELKQKLNQLNIPLTPKQEFEDKFKHYEQNWRELIK